LSLEEELIRFLKEQTEIENNKLAEIIGSDKQPW